jgi:Uma2 family endonuclease
MPDNGLLTVEQFERLPEEDGYRIELSAGRLVREPLPGPRHGRIGVKLGARLDAFAVRHRLGLTFGEAGFVLYRDPDTVRGPDLSFVSHARLPPQGYAGTFWHMAPDLVVEILSPSNRWADMRRKAMEYLDAGSRLVWLIDPARRCATVYQPEAEPLHVDAAGVLDGGDVLPGFSLPLAELFDTP